MNKYKVHQSSIRPLRREINRLDSWGKAAEKFPRVHTYLETTTGGSKRYAPEMFEHYSHVANIEATDLEDVFEIGNIGPEEKIGRLDSMHSISVGDIIEDPAGRFFMVDPFGFAEISIENRGAA